ncbi:MAG: methionine--tRNA ligase [Bdellovibrionaceae bacterium]|nr:methionine--tRNA ligase [Pseudobdellovibrionaceae bacterium]
MKKFFITTAIDYANGSPHLGHAYEKVLTDVVARFRRLMGDEVHFLTGLDEHGQKVQQSARAKGVAPQQYVDEIAVEFRNLCARLTISNDDFVRTTEERHKKVVRAILQQLFDKGEIYKAEYKGFYSTRQEQFLQDKDRNPDGSWPEIYGEVSEITEANYFFKLRAYQEWLLEFLKKNEDFVFPRYRQKQVLEFLSEPLNDLCISRPKERLEWGIPLPFDADQVTYVWFDALINYISAVGFGTERFDAHWPAVHVIGKDILKPAHAIYWPCMLMACGVPLPRRLLVHGFWTHKGDKMSKTTGNVVDPLSLIDVFGVDAFRYYVLREMALGQDADFSTDSYHQRYHNELGNNLGNLLNRTVNMISRYRGGIVPPSGAEDTALRRKILEAVEDYRRGMEKLQMHVAVSELWKGLSRTNQYVEETAPWKLAKDPAQAARLDQVLGHLHAAVCLLVSELEALLPATVARALPQLGLATALPGGLAPSWPDTSGCLLGTPEVCFLGLNLP